MVVLAQTSNAAQADELLVGYELADRYAISAVLARMGTAQTFRAMDRLLEREVALVLGSPDSRDPLIACGKAVARITNPHVVNVFGCGDYEGQSFVVFEQPASTLATFVQEVPEFWSDEARVVRAAQELVIGLIALHRVGVATSELHLGSIGIDDGGRIQLSPWPLSDPSPVVDAASPIGNLALVASLIEAGARGDHCAEFPNAATSDQAGASAADLSGASLVTGLSPTHSIGVSMSTAQIPAVASALRTESMTSRFHLFGQHK
ncbi:MAG TPA: hypothetical protein VNG12_04540 [Acidimicrobiales bacterium]|nr:hypothetical protein [Acidimicrobiales bacterium]